MIRRGRIHMALAEFDATPAGWADELYLQEAGWDAAACGGAEEAAAQPGAG